jgi:hypothetical protein
VASRFDTWPRPKPRQGGQGDPRYHTRRWKETRLRILRRDLWTCWVPDCAYPVNTADHIIPVTPDMENSLFFDPENLRASCRPHNVRRGVAARLERETAGMSGPQGNPRYPSRLELVRHYGSRGATAKGNRVGQP